MLGPGQRNTGNSSAHNSGNEVSALKTQIKTLQKREKDYQDRITQTESRMQALECKADSGSILNSRTLTNADGKAAEGAPPGVDESFLKSLTCNLTFRAGFQFNGNGGGRQLQFQRAGISGLFVSISVYNGRRTVNRTVASNG